MIFEAPGIVRYRTEVAEKGLVFGGALHCMPLGLGKSRLLFRTYYKVSSDSLVLWLSRSLTTVHSLVRVTQGASEAAQRLHLTETPLAEELE